MSIDLDASRSAQHGSEPVNTAATAEEAWRVSVRKRAIYGSLLRLAVRRGGYWHYSDTLISALCRRRLAFCCSVIFFCLWRLARATGKQIDRNWRIFVFYGAPFMIPARTVLISRDQLVSYCGAENICSI